DALPISIIWLSVCDMDRTDEEQSKVSPSRECIRPAVTGATLNLHSGHFPVVGPTRPDESQPHSPARLCGCV
ncbi:MAG: hypothetical protein VB858_22110, partial [Planctomycetaceae bacterium]